MLNALLSPVKQVLDVPFKRIVKFAIKSSVIGRYLHKDLKFEQFCVSLTSGEAELVNVEVKTEAVEEDYGHLLQGLPFRIKRIHIEKMAVKAFGGQSEGLYLFVSGITLVICPASPVAETPQEEAGQGQELQQRVKEKEEDGLTPRAEKNGLELDDIEEEELSRAAQDGLQSLGDWLEEYASGLQVEIRDVSVKLWCADVDLSESEAKEPSHLELCVPTFSFLDVTEGRGSGLSRYKSIEVGGVSAHLVTGAAEKQSQIFLGTNETSVAMVCMSQQTNAVENVRLTVPWLRARITPRLVAEASKILDPFISTTIGNKKNCSTKNNVTAAKSVGKAQKVVRPTGIEEEEEEEEEEDEFHDALSDHESLCESDNQDEVMPPPKPDVSSAKQTEAGPLSMVSVEVQVLRFQLDTLYADPGAVVPVNEFQQWNDGDTVGNFIDRWLYTPELDHVSQYQSLFEEISSASCVDRFVFRVSSTVFRAKIFTDPTQTCASLELGQCSGVEILAKSPLDPSQGMVHFVLDMDTSTVQACRVDFVLRSSLAIKFSPLILSWDNAMATRMLEYLPEVEPSLDGPTPQVHQEAAVAGAGGETGDSSAALTPASTQTAVAATTPAPSPYSFRLVTPKALVVIRVPLSLGNQTRWKKEALVIDMTDVEAQNVSKGMPYDASLRRLPGAMLEENKQQRISDPDFYAEVEKLRSLSWKVLIDFAYAKACIAPVPFGMVDWALMKDKASWALSIGASADLSSAKVALPRMVMCARKPFASPTHVLKATQRALLKAQASRRAFKNRVHQRRAPGEECADEADPAGDHDLDKDRDPPVHTVIETTMAHGFATAESSVRLLCPTATIKLDRVQYHSMNATLQLIVGTIPSFTKPPKSGATVVVAADDDCGASPGSAPPMEKNQDMFWDDDFQANATAPSSLDAESSSPPDLGDIAHGIIEASKPAAFFFQMESNEGLVEISDDCSVTEADYTFNYFGLQVSLVDAMTMIESMDLTLQEIVPDLAEEEKRTSQPVFYSTKWGRHALHSPPLVQMFINSSPSLGKDTTIINMCVETLTLRYNVHSNWLADIATFLGSSPPEGAISLAEDVSPPPAKEQENSGSSIKKAETVSYTEMTVEFFDSIIEYRPLARSVSPDGQQQQKTSKDAALMYVSLLRMSSNIVTPAVFEQSYHVTFRDVAVYASNDAPPWQACDHLCTTLLPYRAYNTHLYSSVDDFTGCMLYAKLATLDIMELFIRMRDEMPGYNYEFSVPTINLYTCSDSLLTLGNLAQELAAEIEQVNEQLRAQDEQRSQASSVQTEQQQQMMDETQQEPQRQKHDEPGIEFAGKAALPSQEQQTGEDEEEEEEEEEEERQPAPIPNENRGQVDAIPDDEKSASQLRNSYLSADMIPDDQLSGPQLRSRHAVQKAMEEDQGGVFLDGFYAVESFDIPENAATSSPKRSGDGVWFDIDDAPAGSKESSQDLGPTGALEESESSLTGTSPRLLLWDDPVSGEQKEFELDEVQRDLDSDDEVLGMRQVEEDARRALREQRMAESEFASILRQEYPDYNLYTSAFFDDDDGGDDDGAHGIRKVSRQPVQENHQPGATTDRLDLSSDPLPQGGWYQGAQVKIFPHYMGIPYEAGPGSHVPPPEALAARLEGGRRRASAPPAAPKGDCESRYVVRDVSIKWILFGGCDWNSTALVIERKEAGARKKNRSKRSFRHQHRQLQDGKEPSENPRRRLRHRLAGRKTDLKVEIHLQHLSSCMSTFIRPKHFRSREAFISQSVAVAVRDFCVIDHLPSSNINQMLCEWVSELQHPRITGSSMLRFAFEYVTRPDRDTSCIRLSLLPLKVNLDQDTLDFLMSFFSIEPMDVDATKKAKVQQTRASTLFGDDEDEDEDRGNDNDEQGAGNQKGDLSEDEELEAVIVYDNDFRIDTLDIRATKLRIDYRPKRVSLSGVVEGDRMALINLFAYEGLEVALRRVELDHLRGWHDFSQQLQVCWLTDIKRHKLKCLAGVSFPPLNTIANLGAGLTNLVALPLEQYKRDGRIVHGVRRGTASFVRTVAIEALGTLSKAAMTAQTLLEHVRDVITPGGQSSAGRILGLGESPASISGRNIFARELKCAAFVLFAMPYEEFQRSGVTSGVKSALRGVPIAVIRTGIGFSTAMSTGLQDLKNTVDPDGKKEAAQKFKTNM